MLSTANQFVVAGAVPALAAPVPFAIVASPRSGTHLVRELINSNPQAALLVESFLPLEKPVYWTNFVRTLTPKEFPALLPEDAMALLDRHMRLVERDVFEDKEDYYGGSKTRLAALGLDVKYNQLRSVTALLADLRSPPLLVAYFRSRNFRIVHLLRNNVVQAALSLIIAKLRNVWINEDSRMIEGQFQISWEALRSEITWIVEERQAFLRCAYDLPIYTCTYEDLVADLSRINEAGEFPTDTIALQPLADFLGIPNQFRYTNCYRKVINRPYSEIIENYDELVRAIRDSEYSRMADTI